MTLIHVPLGPVTVPLPLILNWPAAIAAGLILAVAGGAFCSLVAGGRR